MIRINDLNIKHKFSLNDYVVLYPTEKGWNKISKIIETEYEFTNEKAIEFILSRKTTDGGYKEQLWQIIQDFHEMFSMVSSIGNLLK